MIASRVIELHPFQFEFLRQIEGDVGLGRQNNLFVSGKGGAARTRACAGGRADRGSFAASSERTDDPAERGTAASQTAVRLPLPFSVKLRAAV